MKKQISESPKEGVRGPWRGPRTPSLKLINTVNIIKKLLLTKKSQYLFV